MRLAHDKVTIRRGDRPEGVENMGAKCIRIGEEKE